MFEALICFTFGMHLYSIFFQWTSSVYKVTRETNVYRSYSRFEVRTSIVLKEEEPRTQRHEKNEKVSSLKGKL